MKDYKFFLKYAGFILILLILAGLQIAFFNPFLSVNFVLLLVLFLIIKKFNYLALLAAWMGGLLIDTAHFPVFGATSLVLVILVIVLISIHKTIFFTRKTEAVILIGISAVVLFRLLEFIVNNGLVFLKGGNFENLGFFFLNYGFFLELALTAAVLTALRPAHSRQLNKIHAGTV